MPPKPKIFISHSTSRDDEAARFRDDLAEAIRDAGFPVLLDKDVLQLGDSWRPTINTWIGGCDVAIVLLSPDALKSDFVAYETAVLGYRRAVDPGFNLWPIRFASVSNAAIEHSRLKPSMIGEIQWTVARDQETIDAVLGRLAAVVARATPLDRCAQQVREILDKVGDAAVDDHLGALNRDVRPWMPDEDRRSELAVSMLAAGLPASLRFIRAVRKKLVRDGSLDDLHDLIRLIAYSWIDYRSIKSIPEIARDHTRRILSVNAKDPAVACMYVHRAAVDDENLPPSDSWVVGEMDPIGQGTRATSAEDDLYERALCAFVPELGDDVDEVRKQLKDKTTREPVFVALRLTEDLTPESLRDLRGRLDGVSLFLLAGDERLRDNLRDLAVLLEPELEPGVEEDVLSTFRAGLAIASELVKR